MAKQKQEKGHKNHNNGSGGRLGSVTENIKKAEAGRERNRKTAKLLEARRRPERESGEFYIRTNASRNNDIDALLRGDTGDYTFPGGGEPSMHLSVQREVRKYDTISVIRLESIQKGHELEGAVFDPKVYLPCSYVQKFGTSFRSQAADRLASATQELVCHYLAKIEVRPPTVKKIEPTQNVDVFAKASTDYTSMITEKRGVYLVQGSDGDVVFEVFHANKANIRVVGSKSPRVTPSQAYVPVHCLFKPALEQVTNSDTYEKQLALFMFLRNELGELLTKSEAQPSVATAKTDETSTLTQADRDAIAKAQAKRERQQKNKFAQKREELDRKMALIAMKQNCLPVTKIVSGSLGYADFSSKSGELIVSFYEIGADRRARIEHLGDCHMLKLAGIKAGDSILANHIRFGIDAADRTRLNLNETEYRKQSIFAEHIREQMEARGIRFLAKAAVKN